MLANRHNLSEILEKTVRLVAPLFQRPYVWNQERNWEPLWDAIQSAAERRLTSNQVRAHFLGAVVLNQQWTPMGRVPSREIIDGQQRLTTLQIAMAAARDLLAEAGNEFFSRKLATMTLNHTRHDDEERYKVWPTNRDRQEFAAAMRQGAELVATTPPGRSRLLDAYRYFRAMTVEWLNAEGEERRDVRTEALATVFTQDLILVVIDLDQDDDGQLIFETLNALGTPLLPSDLVKNLLFHESEKAGLDSEGIYRQYWEEFETNDKYWRQELNIGRLKRPRLDVFLQHYLTLKSGRFVAVEGAFRAYRELLLAKTWPSIEQAFAEFREYADIYQSFDHTSPGTPEHLFFSRIWILETQAIVPVVIEVFRKFSSPSDREPFLTCLESFFFRRAICQLTPKSNTRMVVELLSHLRDNGWAANSLHSYFLTREGDYARWPDDRELKEAVVDRPVYFHMQRWRLVELLKLYESSLHTGMTDPITYHGDVTLEHVMPRQWASHWPLPDDCPQEEKDKRNRRVDTYGNLLLVTGKLNSSLSNSAWADKRVGLGPHVRLLLNHEVLEVENWDDKAILSRGEKIYQAFMKFWPRPSTPGAPD